MKQVIEKLVKLDEEIHRLQDVEAENYCDLMEQAVARWGKDYRAVSREEFEAFLESRWTHRPTRSLREHTKILAKELNEVKENLTNVMVILRDYDGYDSSNAAQLKGLIDDVVDWINRGCPYITSKRDGKRTRI